MDPDSRSKKLRRSWQKRHQSGSRISPKGDHKSGKARNTSGKSRRSKVAPTSSFAEIKPSAAPVLLETVKRKPPVCRRYLIGLAGVGLLILLGGGSNIYALSLSLLLPGVALCVWPPSGGLGVWMDRLVLALLAVMLLSFLPQFYWPSPEWRISAIDDFGIDLPLTLSIQPWVSFEAWLCALAGFGWLYAVTSWQINQEGRKRFYFAVSLVVGLLAAVAIRGNITGAAYIGTGDSPGSGFFPNWNQVATILAFGGVAAFGYAMSALRSRQLLPLLGLPVAAASFLALAWGFSRTSALLFLVGMIVWYLLQLLSGRASRAIKLGMPLLLIGMSVFLLNNQTYKQGVDVTTSPEEASEDLAALARSETTEMIKDAPLTGHGLGTFAAVFPQYREITADHPRALHPGSDVLWLTAETGLLGLLLFAGILFLYFSHCRGFSHGQESSYRFAAMAALIIFMLHGLVDVSGHMPGTMYFAIFFAALALPKGKSQKKAYPPRFWRFCGGLLVIFGLVWLLAGLSGLPLHSKVVLAQAESGIEESLAQSDYTSGLREADRWVNQRPMDWKAYFQRASLTLRETGDRAAAAADFDRARFVEPVLGVVALEEGFAWLPYDKERAIAAWRHAIVRELDSREAAYERILNSVGDNLALRQALARLTDIDPELRLQFLANQAGDYLMEEINRDLKQDAQLGQYTREQRTAIVTMWINRGDRVAAKSFLEENRDGLNHPWWLASLLMKERADFKNAVIRIRESIQAPVMPDAPIEEIPLERLKREFSITPGDVMKGTALIQVYLQAGDFQEVRDVTEAMIQAKKHVPGYVAYWHAESFFQLEEYIESWYAFEAYLNLVWGERSS